MAPIKLSADEIYEKERVSVPYITRDDGGGGTGIIYSENGLALTNKHVVLGAKKIRITATNVAGKEQNLPAEILGTDPNIDLAVISFEGGPYRAAKLGSYISEGKKVVALGYPSGPNHLSVTEGIVSSNYIDKKCNIIRHTASINPGNSGGPLFAEDGLIIGINTRISRLNLLPNPDKQGIPYINLEGFNFAIAIEEVTSRIKRLEQQAMLAQSQPSPNRMEEANVLIDIGNSEYSKGQYERAIQVYGEAIRLKPGSFGAYLSRGHSYCALRQYEAAIPDYEAAISHVNPQFFSDLGVPDDQATLAFDLLVSGIYSNKGTAFYALGQYKDAILDYGQTIKIYRQLDSNISDSNLANTYNNRGNAHTGLGQYEPAMRDFNKAIKLNGQVAIFYYNRSVAYSRASARDEAKARELGYQP